MKKLISILTLSALAGVLLAQDFQKGIDFTGVNSVTASRLNNLVDQATPATDRGIVISSSSAPDVVTYPRMTNYIWLDRTTTPPTLKTYGSSWVAGTISPGSVTSDALASDSVISGKIAANAIWTTNLNDNIVTEPKIAAGAVTSSKIATGAVATDGLADYSVTTIKLATNAVTSEKILAGAVTTTKIASDAITTSLLTNSAVTQVKLAAESVATTNFVSTGVSASDYLRRNSGGTAFEWGQLPSNTRVASQLITTNGSFTAVIPIDNTKPQVGEGQEIMSLSITPVDASSTLVVKVEVNLAASSTQDVAIALFRDGAANAVSAALTRFNANEPAPLVMTYAVTAGSTSATTFTVRAGVASGTGYINTDSTGSAVFDGTVTSSIVITEYTP